MFDKLYEMVGLKLKTIAKVFCILGIIGSIIGGISLIINGAQMKRGGSTMILYGILTVIVGALVSWISSLGIYGFGEIVENSDIRTNLACKADAERAKEKQNTDE